MSIDIAMKLSRMIGTSVNYWLNLQNAYDALIAEFKSEEELDKERIILPNIEGSKTNGATKKIGDNIILMVSDRKLNADSFWFTLFHEIGHIINGNYGISFDKETGQQEEAADIFAEDNLIPREQYIEFVQQACFDLQSIREFVDSINRVPSIVLGRIQNDKKVDSNDWTLEPIIISSIKNRVRNNKR